MKSDQTGRSRPQESLVVVLISSGCLIMGVIFFAFALRDFRAVIGCIVCLLLGLVIILYDYFTSRRATDQVSHLPVSRPLPDPSYAEKRRLIAAHLYQDNV